MLTLVVAIEVEVASAVKAAQALDLILHGVGVDDVHDDGHALGMGVVNEVLQFLGGAEA